MLNIVVVQVGNYCGRGAEYVARFFDGVERHIGDLPYRAWCLTDDPASLPENVRPLEPEQDIKGWWAKLQLFKPGIFPAGSRVLSSDLDAIMTGDLSDIANYRGKFAAIRDFYNHNHIQSCLMAWEAGTVDHIWQVWDAGGRPQWDSRGDQAFIESMQPEADYWQDIFPWQIVSFKNHCVPLGGVPPGARIVAFHGRPRPHEIGFDLAHYFATQEMCGNTLPDTLLIKGNSHDHYTPAR